MEQSLILPKRLLTELTTSIYLKHTPEANIGKINLLDNLPTTHLGYKLSGNTHEKYKFCPTRR